MSEPDNPPVCPACNGRGKEFGKAGPDSRVEMPCSACGGSGKFADALLGKLIGEDEQRKAKNVEDYDAFLWHREGV